MIKITTIFSIWLVITVGLLACCAQEKTAKQHLLSPEAFKAYCDSLEQVQIVDVRTPEEWQSGIIENATRINWFDKEFEQLVSEQLDKEKPVIVYCASGGRSTRAQKKFLQLGFKEVYDLQGGITLWKQKKMKTVMP